MSAIATHHKLIKKIKDEKFEEEKLQQYVLLIQIGAKDFQAAVVDSDDNRLIFFEDYVFNEVNSADELFQALQILFDAHEYLKAGFWKEVRISFKNTKFVQVPSGLFEESAAARYLSFNAAIDTQETVAWCRQNSTEAVTIFAVHTPTLTWLKSVYQRTHINLYHQSAALIEGSMKSGVGANQKPLLIYVDRFKLHIMYMADGKLIYYNQFLIRQFADYVRYIMQVMKAMELDQETAPVVLWGYIGKNSPHYQEFIKYVRNVSFGPRPSHLKFGYLFDDIQEHHFFDLYAITLLPA